MLFVPVWDMNRLKAVKFPYVTIALIVTNVFVYFVFQTTLFSKNPQAFTATYAFIPSSLGIPVSLSPELVPDRIKLITYMFLHGGFFHLLGNMVFLFVFGDNVEDAMGHLRFIFFYLICGVFAALAHYAFTSYPNIPLVGASGAISGIIGAYLMLHPNIRVWVLLPLPKIPFIPLRFSAGFVIAVWIAFQVASLFLFPLAATAWMTHIGGLIAGVVLILFMRRPGVRLFDKATGV